MFVAKRKSTMDKLLYDIHVKREEMIHLGLTNGFNNLETIKVSQELDILIVKYQRHKENRVSKWFVTMKGSFVKILQKEKSNGFWRIFVTSFMK